MNVGDLVSVKSITKGMLLSTDSPVIDKSNQDKYQDWETSVVVGKIGNIKRLYGFNKVIAVEVIFPELDNLEAVFLPEQLELVFTT